MHSGVTREDFNAIVEGNIQHAASALESLMRLCRPDALESIDSLSERQYLITMHSTRQDVLSMRMMPNQLSLHLDEETAEAMALVCRSWFAHLATDDGCTDLRYRVRQLREQVKREEARETRARHARDATNHSNASYLDTRRYYNDDIGPRIVHQMCNS